MVLLQLVFADEERPPNVPQRAFVQESFHVVSGMYPLAEAWLELLVVVQ